MINNDYATFWNNCIDDFRRWRKSHPDMAPKLHMLMRQFEKTKIKCFKHLQDYNYTKNPKHLENADKLVVDAKAIHERIRKLEFIATLSK